MERNEEQIMIHENNEDTLASKVTGEIGNDRGVAVVEVILILVEKTLAENTYVLCGN